MNFQWFLSGTARHAHGMFRHVRKLLNHQRDILSPNAVREVETVLQETRALLKTRASKGALESQMESLETAAGKWLKPYPNAAWRENVEVLLVALAVAMAVRTFFLQPFKIPTGSMQPTLWGVTSENLAQDFKIPTGLQRIKEWFQGTSYLHIVADRDGYFEGAEEPVRLAIFSLYQKIHFAGETRWIWFPPDYGSAHLAPVYRQRQIYPLIRASVQPGQFFRKGETMVKLKVNAGDHLFVDRVSYNFRPPDRGEIIVFETHGIDALNQMMPTQGDTFYIKRLAGLGGETIRLEKDYEVFGVPGWKSPAEVGHLVVDGEPLSARTPHFENLYSFSGVGAANKPVLYRENHYYGHAMTQFLAHGREFQIQTNSLFVMGDNTFNSSDSRYWGDFPKSKVIGKSFFVYWPLTARFGWASSQ